MVCGLELFVCGCLCLRVLCCFVCSSVLWHKLLYHLLNSRLFASSTWSTRAKNQNRATALTMYVPMKYQDCQPVAFRIFEAPASDCRCCFAVSASHLDLTESRSAQLLHPKAKLLYADLRCCWPSLRRVHCKPSQARLPANP